MCFSMIIFLSMFSILIKNDKHFGETYSSFFSEINILEKMIDKETKHADDIHRHLFDKIDEIKNILLRKNNGFI